MASNPHGHMYDLLINGHKFQTATQFITGKQILELAGLHPVDQYEVLMKLHGKEYEPVELTETKDLDNPGIESFEVNHVHQLTVNLDDEDYPVSKCFMTPIEILALDGKSPEQYYLKQILEHKEISYKEDEKHIIAIVCKMRFSSCKKGATGVS